METANCSACLKPKATLECQVCHEPIGKCCAQILAEGAFSFWTEVPEVLAHEIFCPNCYDAHVAAPLKKYLNIIERAKEVRVFFDHQGKETRWLKRIEKSIAIPVCDDKDEALLRLAFHAAEKKCNALVDVSLVSEKTRSNHRQSTAWRASGVPMQIRSERVLMGAQD